MYRSSAGVTFRLDASLTSARRRYIGTTQPGIGLVPIPDDVSAAVGSGRGEALQRSAGSLAEHEEAVP
jgi:hypothetical protein